MVIVDTSGRLQVNDELMAELVRIRDAAKPDEALLVADAMTGQNAVDIAKEFDARVSLTGVILSKFDSDTRGGAALSIKSITGKPIRFIGTGEKLDGLEPFHPERIASRILGMGDVVSLVEKAQKTMEMGEAMALQDKLSSETFTLEDMLDQYRRMRKMGSLQSLVEMIPGLKGAGAEEKIDEAAMRREEAIILSMTPTERRNYRIIGPGRRARIARGQRDLGVRGEQVLEKVREDVSDDEEDVAERKIPGPGDVAARRREELTGHGDRERRGGKRVSVRIRLKRFGTKKRPFYRIVVDGFAHAARRQGARGDRPVPAHREAGEAGRHPRGEAQELAREGRHAVRHGEADPEQEGGGEAGPLAERSPSWKRTSSSTSRRASSTTRRGSS